jgi:hypothetical protein
MASNSTEQSAAQLQIEQLFIQSETSADKNPTQGFAIAQEALAIAVEQELPVEQCKALMLMAKARISAADNSTQTEQIWEDAIILAEKHKLEELLVEALSQLASLKVNSNQIEDAAALIKRAKQCLQAMPAPSIELSLMVSYDDINIRYRQNETGPEILTDCLRGVEQSIVLSNEGLQTSFLQMLAMTLANSGDTEAAIRYSKQLIEIEERREYHMSLVGANVYQSGLYEKMGNLEEAEKSFARAVASSKILGDERSLYLVELRRVKFLIDNKKYSEAKVICDQLAHLQLDREMPKQRFNRIMFMANIAEAENETARAVHILEPELIYYKHDAQICMRITEYLHELYAKAGDFRAAYQTLCNHHQITKEIYDVEKAKEYAELHTRYETKEKEALLRESQLQRIDAELKAIKSQMNPHFAFNALKTIDRHLENQNVNTARESLHKFAQLMRATLQQSGSEYTLIEGEILLLQNYVQLEKTALGDSFHYTIEVDSAIDQSYEQVPSIFLQPVVENAIKHGLRHQQGLRKLSIVFSLKNDILCVTVEDNGIGRKASADLNKFRPKHDSFATNALQRRVEFLNTKAGFDKYRFEIEDLSPGTRAVLYINQRPS